MSIEKVKAYFRNYGLEDRVQEFEVSNATVQLAYSSVSSSSASPLLVSIVIPPEKMSRSVKQSKEQKVLFEA